MKIQCRTTSSAATLKSAGYVIPSSVVLWVALNRGPWYPFFGGNTSCHAQNSAILINRRWGNNY